MSQPRTCQLCKQPLATREFWDNLGIHKDCLDKVIQQVQVEWPGGKVEVKK